MNKKTSTRLICVILAVLMALSLIVGVIPIVANAEEIEDDQLTLTAIQQRKQEISSMRVSAQERLEILKSEESTVIEEKIALEERNEAAKDEIELIREEIVLYTKMIEEKTAEVSDAQSFENQQKERYRTRIRSMEENGSYNILSLIINSENFSQLLTSLDDYGDVMNSDQQLYDKYQDARKTLQNMKKELEELKSEYEEEERVLDAELTELAAQIEESAIYIEELKIAISSTESEIAAAKRIYSSGSSSIGTYMSSTYADGYTQSSVTGTGTWVWPFESSNRVSSTMKNRWGRTHDGIDIDGFNLEGSSISAADTGTVVESSYNSGYGNYVIIDHGNGYQTLYAHLDSSSVSEGDTVTAGDSIGAVGSTGSSTGTHLHFEMYENGQRIDPLDAYSGGYELEPGADTPS